MLHKSEKNTSLKYMYFSCQITKRELDPGATDASEVHDSLNENASRVMSLCMCLDMFKYA
jgi:hypothetical protein